jgi:hypothetical protein
VPSVDEPAIPRQMSQDNGRDRLGSTDYEAASSTYQAAITLWTSEAALIWSIFNAMVVANSVILAAAGLLGTSANNSRTLSIALPFAGLILCIMWFTMTRRGYDYHRYWVLSAREIEESALRDIARTVSRGGDFAEGRRVELTFGQQKRSCRMSWVSRTVRARAAAYVVIFVFAAIHLIVLLQAGLR